MELQIIARKLGFVVITFGVYYNTVIFLLRPDAYQNPFLLTYLLILYVAGTVDAFLRPLHMDRPEEENYAKYILLLFLANPLLFVLGLVEHDFFFLQRSKALAVIGLLIYFSAAALTVLSRIQLGKQATGTLSLVEDHELIQTGLYGYVRHPMYLGSLVGILGFALVVQSIIVPLISFILYFWVFNNRVKYEEKILKNAFGEQHDEYVTQTKKFIPFIY